MNGSRDDHDTSLNDLVFVGDRCDGHSPSSGYDQLCSLFPRAGWLGGRALRAGRLEWHRSPASLSRPLRSVFHVLYGDASGSHLPGLLRARFPSATIVSTIHKPIAVLREDPVALSALVRSDAILTVSEIQAREIVDLDLEVPVYALAHGVWTHKFRPSANSLESARSQILLVGNYLRDWAAAQAVIESLGELGVKSIIVGARGRVPDSVITCHPLVEASPRLSESDLAQLYERSAAVFLPFFEATASNALLEAMSAGCPVVCTRMPAPVDEYLGDAVDAFEREEVDVAVRRLLRYVRDPRHRTARARLLQRRADRFDWSTLKPRYIAAYDEIMTQARERTPPASGTRSRPTSS